MKYTLNEDGMPIFIDMAGLPSAEQWAFACRQIARLEENDRDCREWLRDIELRIDDLVEIRKPKKRWWKRWKK